MAPKFKLKDWSRVALLIAIIVAIVDFRGGGCSYVLKGLREELNGARKIHEKKWKQWELHNAGLKGLKKVKSYLFFHPSTEFKSISLKYAGIRIIVHIM